MMQLIFCLVGAVLTFSAACAVYRCFNQGMARKAIGQQTRRFAIASVLAWLPVAVAGSVGSAGLMAAWLTGWSWGLTYPALYHLSNRRTQPDYEHYGEISCGIYFFGWLSALWLLGGGVAAALIEWVLLLVSVSLLVYYLLYGSCIDANGMKIVQDSHPNEIIEYARSYRWWQVAVVVLLLAGLLALLVWMNGGQPANGSAPLVRLAGVAALWAFFTYYIFKRPRGMFVRSGIVSLWLDIKEYAATNLRYKAETGQRLKKLSVKPLGQPFRRPSTILMVIGESASRDYMSAFTDMPYDTTPWMASMAADPEAGALLFPHAYSCAMHTVQVLEKSLTEFNQYNGRQFYDSCSVIDIAHQLGYRVHWYSNQGHLGAADTPITLVAETADVAKWTKQELGKPQYDETLLDFLNELDPGQNNFLVLHLKGSHFNFSNRFPADRAVWSRQDGHSEEVAAYMDSLRYTDDVLRQAFDYCSKRLNLQAMVYFSDHATVPDRKRSPNFSGFGDTRIPLFVWTSSEYRQLHQSRYDALRANTGRYFTNDLIYELMCGIFDISSEHFDETGSLASPLYRYQREDLLTYEGKVSVASDSSDIAV